MSFPTNDYEKELARLAQGESTKAGKLTLTASDFDLEQDAQVQTDKSAAKLLPCRECKRPLVVTTFFAPAKAVCSICSGQNGGGVASVGQPVPGQTEPSKAVNMADVLVNKPFAKALCPVHPENPEHEMHLIGVTHNPNYGPSVFVGYANGKPEYRQIAIGETAMHQCQACLATVAYSTTGVVRLRPMNEPKQDDAGRGVNVWADVVGVREPLDYPDYEQMRADAPYTLVGDEATDTAEALREWAGLIEEADDENTAQADKLRALAERLMPEPVAA